MLTYSRLSANGLGDAWHESRIFAARLASLPRDGMKRTVFSTWITRNVPLNHHQFDGKFSVPYLPEQGGLLNALNVPKRLDEARVDAQVVEQR
jgi:hypothetical protein